MTRPLFIVLAGPNGSGKTTLTRLPTFLAVLESRDVTVINPDDLARAAPSQSNSMIWSGRRVHELTHQFISKKLSFLVETTLSGRNHFKTVQSAKHAGFDTALHFVFVSSLLLAKSRVQLRVKLGGHDVPEVDQDRRYEKSLAHAAEMIKAVDEAHIYLNDYRSANHQRIAQYSAGVRLTDIDTLPPWLS